MKTIKNEHLTGERALFRLADAEISECLFDDGESPLKECRNLVVRNCVFGWKYPLWYGKNLQVDSCKLLEMGRAAIWYTEDSSFKNLHYEAPKGFRHCKNITVENVIFQNAQETMWWSDGVKLTNVKAIGSGYFGMGCKNVTADHLELENDYAFDGAENLVIRDSTLHTKDAFWNSKHVRLERCKIEGEYFAWNSEDVTLIDCEVSSLQGFCYMKGVKLVRCKVTNTDRAFEYCEDIDAEILTRMISIKNPISGHIVCKGADEIIRDDERLDPSKTEIIFDD